MLPYKQALDPSPMRPGLGDRRQNMVDWNNSRVSAYVVSMFPQSLFAVHACRARMLFCMVGGLMQSLRHYQFLGQDCLLHRFWDGVCAV